MAITASAIAALVGRFNNKVVVPQALLSFPALDKKVVTTLKKPTERGTVNVKAGGLSSTGLIADAGTLPTGASNDITQLTYDPTFIMSRLSIPRGGSTISRNPEDGVDVVMEQMETAGRDLGRTLGRAFYKSTLSTPLAAVSSGATLTVTDVAGWRIGATVEHRESGGNLVQVIPQDDAAEYYRRAVAAAERASRLGPALRDELLKRVDRANGYLSTIKTTK